AHLPPISPPTLLRHRLPTPPSPPPSPYTTLFRSHHTGGLHPFSVTGVTRQGACLGPATVAVHDDGHMLRQDFGPDDGFSVLVAAHYSLGSWPQELGVGWNVRQGPRKANRQNSIRSFSFSSSSASTC